MRISIGSVEMVAPASTCDSLPAPPAGYGSGYLVYHPGIVLNVVAAVVFIIMLPLLSVMTLGLQGAVASDRGAARYCCDHSDARCLCCDPLLPRAYPRACPSSLQAPRVLWDGHGAAPCVCGRVRAVSSARSCAHSCTRAACADHPHDAATARCAQLLCRKRRIMLLANTPGAVDDMHLAWQLLRLPRQTLLYDLDPARMLAFLTVR